MLREDEILLPRVDSTPSLEETYWTLARQELYAWLYRNAPSLAELYEGAVRLLYGGTFPGHVRFVSHAVREIRNRLPDIISGTKGDGRLQYTNRVDDLSKAWQRAGFSLDGSLSSSFSSDGTNISPLPDIQIPPALFFKIATLIKDHETTRTKPEDIAIRLFEACAPENHQLRDTLRPVIRQWLEVTNWFEKRNHDSGRVDADCDGIELRRHFDLFESALGALVRSFFSTTDELDGILEDTNS